MIFTDSFYQTHQGEIFQQSKCMQHEHAVANLFTSLLINLDYRRVYDNDRVWQKKDKTVVVCIADDFGVCRTDYSLPPSKWFDSKTVVITDNYMPLVTDYRVYQLPVSYFGVFNYVPADQAYQPTHRFNFSVNRLDSQRELILLELLKQSGGLDQVQHNDYINFNARTPGNNHSLLGIRKDFSDCWNQLKQIHNSEYQTVFEQALAQIPIRNHQLTVEQAQVGAYINLVIETYAGDASIAFSEKIFRALLTPAPWAVFSAKNAVQYLQQLGFDTLNDIVDHSYDSLYQDTSPYGKEKIAKFISINLQNYQNLKTMDIQQLTARCRCAAEHNQHLLKQLQQKWPWDFTKWLPGALELIQ